MAHDDYDPEVAQAASISTGRLIELAQKRALVTPVLPGESKKQYAARVLLLVIGERYEQEADRRKASH